jgi:alkylhydroperoxidase family enzyme
MPRITYKDANIAEPKDLVDAIRRRRGGALLNLDRLLLHSAPFAKGWNAFMGEVRTGLDVSPKLRELAMCVVAVLNGAEYEFHHHAPEFIKSGGTSEQVNIIRSIETCNEKDLSAFDHAERAAIQLTIEMTKHVQVKDSTFSMVKQALSNDQQVVELVGVIAAYNMVSRFLVALEVEPE